MWGANSDCRLMSEENENRLVPSLTLIEKLQLQSDDYEPYQLALGVTHSALITRNGDLFTAGSKLDGQLGLKYSNPKSIGEQSSRSMESNARKVMNQFKDPRELKELAMPLHQVQTFSPSNRAI
jgi:alpha-tubulin suppressor-like RCC1 family protein